MILPPIHLSAVHPSKNINRWYSLRIGQDLFGDWLLIAQWGRHGFRGQYKQYAFPDETTAQKKFQQILKKRLNSHKRIGCDYAIIDP